MNPVGPIGDHKRLSGVGIYDRFIPLTWTFTLAKVKGREHCKALSIVTHIEYGKYIELFLS